MHETINTLGEDVSILLNPYQGLKRQLTCAISRIYSLNTSKSLSGIETQVAYPLKLWMCHRLNTSKSLSGIET